LCDSNNIFDLPDGSCRNFVREDLADLPPITFQFLGENATVQLNDYIRYIPSQATGYDYCGVLGMSSQAGNTLILGDTFMRQFYTVFDRKNQRIGFATAHNCGHDLDTGSLSKKLYLLLGVAIALLGLLGLLCMISYFVRCLRERVRSVQYLQLETNAEGESPIPANTHL